MPREGGLLAEGGGAAATKAKIVVFCFPVNIYTRLYPFILNLALLCARVLYIKKTGHVILLVAMAPHHTHINVHKHAPYQIIASVSQHVYTVRSSNQTVNEKDIGINNSFELNTLREF